MRVRGTVKWWNNAKGYGFLTQTGGSDVFVHYSAIQGDGFRTLEEAEQVEFELIDGPKGPQAGNVVRLGAIKPEEEPRSELALEVPYLALALAGSHVRLISLT